MCWKKPKNYCSLCVQNYIDHLPTPTRWCEDFEAQLDALITAKPAVASLPLMCCTAPRYSVCIRPVLLWSEVPRIWPKHKSGKRWALMPCLQGVEAGGHRGTFIGEQSAAQSGSYDCSDFAATVCIFRKFLLAESWMATISRKLIKRWC